MNDVQIYKPVSTTEVEETKEILLNKVKSNLDGLSTGSGHVYVGPHIKINPILYKLLYCFTCCFCCSKLFKKSK